MKPRHAAALALLAAFVAVPFTALYLLFLSSDISSDIGSDGGEVLVRLAYLPNVFIAPILTLIPRIWVNGDQFKLVTIIVTSTFSVVAWTTAGALVAKRVWRA
jgi:hypothetical protein